ncbi:MAG: hypothetical protein HY907_02505 [Deltaproteobacteria bacterium]|nr:hypothetical protein [Deltaproteobacteria bacterium]
MPDRLAGVLLLGLTLGCSTVTTAPGPAGPAVSPDSVPSGATTDIHVGCLVIAQSEIDAEVDFTLAEAGVVLDEDARRLVRDELVALVVLEAIVRREAERLGISVSPEEVDEMMALAVEQSFGGDPSALAADLEGKGLTMDAYRARLAEEILELKLMEYHGFLDVTDDEVQAEYARLAAAGDPAASRPFDEAREEIRSRLARDRRTTQWVEYLTRLRERLERVPTHEEDGRCVEDWPEHAVGDAALELLRPDPPGAGAPP